MTFKTLEYYFSNGEHVVFDKYEIGEGTNVRNKRTGNVCAKHVLHGYHTIYVCDDNTGKFTKIDVSELLYDVNKNYKTKNQLVLEEDQKISDRDNWQLKLKMKA